MSGLEATASVRRARHLDLAAIMSCLAKAFEPYRESYTHGAFQDTILTYRSAERRIREMAVLVAIDRSDRVIGTIALQVTGSHDGHLRGMAVYPESQGQGVADRLLNAAEKELRELGCSRVSLDTTEPLQRAIRFYSRNGYKATGVVKDFFGMRLFEYVKSLGSDAA